MRDTTDDRPVLPMDGTLQIADAYRIANGDVWIDITPEARARCLASEKRLQRVIAERRHVYGITTGFGPLANRLVDPKDGVTLQQNLVHHLASGIGPDFDWRSARAIVAARLNTILQGASGASGATIRALCDVLNAGLAPSIPRRGTVGASGDLTPLAHVVLCLQGRGGFLTADGRSVQHTAPPLDLTKRDGLALVNGTAAMTGVALCTSVAARGAATWAIALTAALAEVLHGRVEAWDDAFSRLRPHPGQSEAATQLRGRLEGSTRITDTPLAARILSADDIQTEAVPGQDAYTLRCAPQIIGAVLDTLRWHDEVVTIELNAVTDNPIFPENAEVPALHGGNFMGMHVALASDALGNAITVLAGLAERQVARVTDEKLNGDLPAFLHRGRAGLNSGLMGAQVTATALLAEMRSIGPASTQSISTNGANQDVVSMGTIAARHTAERVGRCYEILAILGLAVAQAMDLRGLDGFSQAARDLHGDIRRFAPPLTEDRPLGPEIATLAAYMAGDHS